MSKKIPMQNAVTDNFFLTAFKKKKSTTYDTTTKDDGISCKVVKEIIKKRSVIDFENMEVLLYHRLLMVRLLDLRASSTLKAFDDERKQEEEEKRRENARRTTTSIHTQASHHPTSQLNFKSVNMFCVIFVS